MRVVPHISAALAWLMSGSPGATPARSDCSSDDPSPARRYNQRGTHLIAPAPPLPQDCPTRKRQAKSAPHSPRADGAKRKELISSLIFLVGVAALGFFACRFRSWLILLDLPRNLYLAYSLLSELYRPSIYDFLLIGRGYRSHA